MEFYIITFSQHSFADFAHESGLAHPRAAFNDKDPGGIGFDNVIIKGIKTLTGIPAGKTLRNLPWPML